MKQRHRAAVPSHCQILITFSPSTALFGSVFFKAILFVQGHPKEFIIDTGSPVTIIPPMINPTEIKKKNKKLRGRKQKPNKIQRPTNDRSEDGEKK